MSIILSGGRDHTFRGCSHLMLSSTPRNDSFMGTKQPSAVYPCGDSTSDDELVATEKVRQPTCMEVNDVGLSLFHWLSAMCVSDCTLPTCPSWHVPHPPAIPYCCRSQRCVPQLG